jgi:hydroxymethylbilane synthase
LLDKNGEILYQETISGSIKEAESMGKQIGKNMLEFL